MGGRSTGILCTQGHSPTGQLHVGLEDCILAGYSFVTAGPASEAVSYTSKGEVLAYVQFPQSQPEGFERLGRWPTELFSQMAPPRSPAERKKAANTCSTARFAVMTKGS
jgi:hypothetical protein